MPSVPTLHSICLDYLASHTEEIVSLEGIPYRPTVEIILVRLFASKKSRLNSSILSVIAESHAKELRAAKFPWTNVILSKGATRSAIPPLIALSKEFPGFITRLDISNCNIDDDDLLLLKGFSNLKLLDMCYNLNISDTGISYLTNIATSPFLGLPYLEGLNLNGLLRVTDKSLKYFRRLEMLKYLNLTNTSVIDSVAIRFLSSLGYQRTYTTNNRLPCVSTMPVSTASNDKFYWFLREIAAKYDQGQKPKPPPAQTSIVDSHAKLSPPSLYFLRNKPSSKKRKLESQPQPQESTPLKKNRHSTIAYFNMIQHEFSEE